LASELRLRRMEHKLKESNNMVSFFRESSVSVAEANPILESKAALITQGDKLFKVFSRPQIDLNDIMKFDKVKSYIAANDLDEEILEQAEIQVKYSGYIDKEKK
jgi:tRNA uridine 5-carboxymethylaminomethyl modification enzyme